METVRIGARVEVKRVNLEARVGYVLERVESGCVKSLGFDFADMRWHTTGSPVTHWMPLPEPPKEGKHDG